MCSASSWSRRTPDRPRPLRRGGPRAPAARPGPRRRVRRARRVDDISRDLHGGRRGGDVAVGQSNGTSFLRPITGGESAEAAPAPQRPHHLDLGRGVPRRRRRLCAVSRVTIAVPGAAGVTRLPGSSDSPPAASVVPTRPRPGRRSLQALQEVGVDRLLLAFTSMAQRRDLPRADRAACGADHHAARRCARLSREATLTVSPITV